MGQRSAAGINLPNNGRGQAGFDRDIGGGAGDFLPRRAQHDLRRLRVKPEIELVARIVDEFRIVGLGADASAHENKLLRQFRKFRIDRNGERQVGHGAALVDRYLVGVLAHLADQEMSRVLVGSFGRGLAFRQGRDNEGLMPPAVIPRAREGHLAEALLPYLSFFMPSHQWENGPGHNWNIGAAHDLEQAQRVRHFLVAPLVSADYRDSQDFDLRGLNQQSDGLHVAATGPRPVLIDDDFAPLL
jgi:hypothetical protein